jgi:hypothetical protein
MAYDVYYPAGCDVAVPDHYCNPCDVIEHGRVRSVAFIAKDFVFTDPTDPTEWEAGIADKKIIVIPDVNGSFDGGAPVENAGYGDQQTKLVGYNFSLTFRDPNYKNNADFYNALKLSRNYRFGYRTETQVHLTENTVTVVPKNPVGEDLTSEVVWDVEVKWSEGDLPTPNDTPPGIFTCYAYGAELP